MTQPVAVHEPEATARPALAAGTGRRVRRWRANGGIAALAFAAPVTVLFVYFSWGPIVGGLVMSWQKTNLVDPPQWVGWSNFAYVLSDPLLPQAALNTLYFVLLGIVFGFPVPLVLAVFMAELRGRSKSLFSVLAYLPAVVPPVVAILLWQTLYSPSGTGTFNELLGALHIGPFSWLSSPTMAMPAIVLELTWATAGSTVIIYLAALGSVPGELYEAAELDGAGIRSRIWHITLPQLRGVILILFLLQVIGTAQVFSEPYLFTGGGPDNATNTILLMVYHYAFIDNDYGAATALSFLLALVLAVFSIAYQLATRKWNTQ